MEMSLDAAAAIEDKRSRQRQHAKRSYYKRVKAMAALKAEREVLEQQYREALATASLPALPSLLQEQQLGHTDESELVDRIMALSTARDELRVENQALKSAVVRFFTLQRRLQQSLEDMDNNDSDLSITPTQRDDSAVDTVIAQQFERVMLTTPLTPAAVCTLNRQSHTEMRAFVDASSSSSITGASSGIGTQLCGWQEFRDTTQHERFRFATRKLFPRQSAVALATKTWHVVSDARAFQDMYSSNITMQLDVVQRVDDNSVVFYRTMQIPNSTTVSKTLLLVSRFVDASDGGGHVVLLRSLDQSLLQSLVIASDDATMHSKLLALVDDTKNESDSIWMDVFSWVVFRPAGKDENESCAMEFGGFVRHATSAASEFWMLEALLISIRWESRVVGPVFRVEASSEEEEEEVRMDV